MTPRALGIVALPFGPLAALWTQLAGYLLVDSARHFASRTPTVLGVLAGAVLAASGLALSLRAHRRAGARADRFLGLLGACLNGYFLFVVVVGFGIPNLWLGPTD